MNKEVIMSALLLFVILMLAGVLIIFLGRRIRGPLMVLSLIAGAVAALIGLYGVFTYFL